MANKLFRQTMKNDKGTLSGVPLILLTLIVITAVLGLLAHWFLGGPTGERQVEAQPTPVVTALVPTPTVATTAAKQLLWQVLDDKLKSLDLLKLEVSPATAAGVTIDGKVVPTHIERYRLPELYSPQQLADLLAQVAATQDAKLVAPIKGDDQQGVGTVFSCLYSNGSEAAQIDWVVTNKPRICLIIDDGGYQKGAALEALYGFKVPVTCAIIPHTQFSNFLAQDFPSHGVEVMCHLPMEGHDHVAPGTYKEYLKHGMNLETAREETKSGLADLPNCRGLNNHMGSVATLDLKLIETVCEELKTQNMFIIDSKTSPKAIVSKAAKEVGIPVAQREFFLDNQKTPYTVIHEMRLTAAYAQKHGVAVAIGHFNVVTLKTLKVEVAKLAAQGFQFVYASEVVK